MIVDLHEEKQRLESELEKHKSELQKHKHIKPIAILATIALLLQSGLFFIALFQPGLPYLLTSQPEPIQSPQYFTNVAELTGARLGNIESIDVLTNGTTFYPAELAAIRGAQQSVDIEAYIFEYDDIGKQVLQALTERARAGVRIRLLVDAVGSKSVKDRYVKELRDAHGQVVLYNALRWYTWPRINNRTHRELTIVDGKIGFIGGAGYADHWYKRVDKDPQWRDTMVRVTGSIVTSLQATFAENWLEGAGDLLNGHTVFPLADSPSGNAMVVASTPSNGGSSPARVLVQMLLAGARSKIYITTPYFVPDSSMQDEMIRAMQRHVDLRILVPGTKSDHALTRGSSRRHYGDLLKAGAAIYEYQPSMIHAKIMIIDDLWVAVGSTNLDSRSANINDEVNLAVPNAALAQRLEKDYFSDLSKSRRVSYDEWKKRPVTERFSEWVGGFIERQE